MDAPDHAAPGAEPAAPSPGPPSPSSTSAAPPTSALLRRSRMAAQLGFVLGMTALLLAWWRVTWSTDGITLRDDVRAFRPEEPLTTAWGPWLTGALMVAALLLVAIRIAARSEAYEPRTWRRDVGLATLLVLLALASCMLWPADVPSFWGGRAYLVENVTTEVHEAARPGLGWWTAVLAASCFAIAWHVARPRPLADGADDP